MDRSAVEAMLVESHAMLEGHFKLSSGLHADRYIQCAQVQQYPDRLAALCAALAERWGEAKVTAVVGPAVGGIVIAYELARQLGARGLFMERTDDGFAFRRGFGVGAADRVLVSEDVVTTGKSAREVLEVLKDTDATLVGVTSLICRDVSVDFGVDYLALIDFDVPAYAPEDCPLCKAGVPVTKPGSRPDAKETA